MGDKLIASTLSTLNKADYMEVSFKTKMVMDKRKTKYAPERQSMDIDDIPVVMGERSRQTLLTRMALTQDVSNNVITAMEI